MAQLENLIIKEKSIIIDKTYKYRLYPSKKQQERLISNFKICKMVYNNLLALSKDAHKFGDISLTKFDYNHILKNYSCGEIHSQVLQNVSDRVYRAYQSFFKRLKNKSCKKKGFPRFKNRVNSITYPQSGFKIINQGKLYASKIGNIPIKLHRATIGKTKTLTIKVNRANQWFACFTNEIEIKVNKHHRNEKIGIDVGLEQFATLSNGQKISNPHFLVKTEKRLRILQRRLSRKKKGSKNRLTAKSKVAKQYIRVANQRNDFLHKLSRSLALRYSTIAVENLNIKGMVQNPYLAKHIIDASWSRFIQMLSYKAVTCGGQLIKNPRTKGSSCRCSKCGESVEMPLKKREFQCHVCGITLHRDHNSAINQLKDTVGLTEISTPVDDQIRPSSEGKVGEAGTICRRTSSAAESL